jgi:hypothetical protein
MTNDEWRIMKKSVLGRTAVRPHFKAICCRDISALATTAVRPHLKAMCRCRYDSCAFTDIGEIEGSNVYTLRTSVEGST